MNRQDIESGFRTALPILLGALPFGVLFGTIATDRGLSMAETMLMSLTIYAGASQLVGIELFQHDVAPWIIVLSILAVNFRHVLYSAALAKHLGRFSTAQKFFGFFFLVDPQFAESLKKAETAPPLTMTWYMAFAMTFYIPWQAATLLGVIFGKFVGDPKTSGLDVLLTIYFLGLVLSFRSKDNFLPVVGVSSAVAIGAWHVLGSPWHISVGAIAGILLAAILPVRKGEDA